MMTSDIQRTLRSVYTNTVQLLVIVSQHTVYTHITQSNTTITIKGKKETLCLQGFR